MYSDNVEDSGVAYDFTSMMSECMKRMTGVAEKVFSKFK